MHNYTFPIVKYLYCTVLLLRQMYLLFLMYLLGKYRVHRISCRLNLQSLLAMINVITIEFNCAQFCHPHTVTIEM